MKKLLAVLVAGFVSAGAFAQAPAAVVVPSHSVHSVKHVVKHHPRHMKRVVHRHPRHKMAMRHKM